MAEIEIKRVNFFDGQFLKQGEFNDLSDYLVHMRRRLLVVLFNQSGVVQAGPSDLTVEVVDAGQKIIRVKAGMAIGKRPDLVEAKEIILTEDTLPIDLKTQQPPLQAGDTAIVAVHYEEEGVANPPSQGDVPGNTRIKEHAVITIHRNTLPGPAAANGEPFIRLGDINFTSMAINTTQRQAAFLNASLLAATPQISVSPNTPTAGSNVVMTVTSSGGFNLSGVTAGNVVISPNTGVSNIAVSNQTANSLTLTFTLAGNAAAGSYTVTITVNNVNAQGTFTVSAGMQLTSFTGVDEPNNVTVLAINGSGFAAGQAALVEFAASGGGTAPVNVPAGNVTATQIQIPLASIPGNATTGLMTVTSGGQIATGLNVVPPATITSFSPTSVSVNGAVTINGSRFFTGTAVGFGGNVSRGPASAPPFPSGGAGESLTTTQIVVRVPPGAQSGRIRITTDGGTVQSAITLTV